MSKHFDALKTHLDRAMALKTALALFEWDNETLAPKEAGELTGNVIGILSGEYFQAVNNDQVKELVKACKEDGTLTLEETAQVRVHSKGRIPGICAPGFRLCPYLGGSQRSG